MLPYVIGFFACLAVLGYYLLFKPHKYWKNHGVELEKPKFFFGHWKPVASKKLCAAVHLKSFYDKYPGKRCVPLYQFLKPALLLRDPELIKQVTVKDFDAFPNRSAYMSKSADPVGSSMMFFLQDNEWRDVRNTLSPAFTKHKLSSLYDLVIECAQQFTNYFDHKSKYSATEIVELKSEFIKIANDMITTTAFGIKTNSLKDPTNELFTNGKNIIDVSGFFNSLKFYLVYINPFLSNMFQVKFSSNSVSQFFVDIVKRTIKFREENGVTRPDMMQLMIEARKRAQTDDTSPSKISSLTDEKLAAQCMLFYIAGFDTMSTTLSFLSYELALNPHVQERLLEEVTEAFQNGNGKISYDALLNMKYLDMVVSESSRKWPAISLLDRCTTTTFNLTVEEEKQLCIDTNVALYISVFGLHRDPVHWPDPEKFDPERFNDDNKPNIKPYTFMPFGVGPRSCIASRFALVAEKAVIANLLYKFEIVKVEKTAVPLKLAGDIQDQLEAEEYWLGLKPRQAIQK